MNRVILDPVSKRFVDTGEKVARYHSDETKRRIGLGNLGKQLSEEAKKKLRLINLGKHPSKETKEKISSTLKGRRSPRLGQTASIETREKMSVAHKNPSEETRRKLSLATSGTKNPMFGKQHTKEAKKKMQLAQKGERHWNYGNRGEGTPNFGKHHSDEAKKKISLAHKGREHHMFGKQHSKETKEKISLTQRGENSPNFGKHFSDETRKKMSIATLAHYQDPEYVAKRMLAQGLRPNKAELFLQEILDRYFPNTYKYTGNFQVNIGGKFPDFINTKEKTQVIELFGNYWHTIEEVEPTMSHYKQHNFSCIVIWEEELESVENLLEHIRNGSIYLPKYLKNYKPPKEENKIIILDPVTKMFSQVGSDVKNGN